MPPRGKLEGLVTNVAAPAFSFQDEKFIEQLLQSIAERDGASLLVSTARALGAEDYLIDLKHQIILDSRLDFLRFCADQKYGPSQIVHLIKWMNQFQLVVEKGCDMEEMRKELTNFVSSEIEEGWKWRQTPPIDENAAEQPPPSKSASKKAARATDKVAVEEVEATTLLPRENMYLTKESIGPFCIYLFQGIIQHASLHVYVARHQQETRVSNDFSIFVELPVPAPPLRLPITQEAASKEVYPSHMDVMKGLRETELASLVNEYEETKAKEELWEKTKKTEEEMQILIENEGTKRAVEDTYERLEADLTQRQRRILQRITALEKKIGIDSSL
ncbi:uncharacterized protein Tco025E_04325 [Trypanosoma conorhini]|uniref:Uncharacterized protein n=1 Tax=Trypanosoma conorhini TaxID=83891 RepID=A0A422PMF3_9TRYP|nr:uncharacterized protein Tco025E_04325 [Trypanosoma conorhini]RNF18889.1 hypothetical protein Tco025E_04325 [Trypanosoma conorhini]